MRVSLSLLSGARLIGWLPSSLRNLEVTLILVKYIFISKQSLADRQKEPFLRLLILKQALFCEEVSQEANVNLDEFILFYKHTSLEHESIEGYHLQVFDFKHNL